MERVVLSRADAQVQGGAGLRINPSVHEASRATKSTSEVHTLEGTMELCYGVVTEGSSEE